MPPKWLLATYVLMAAGAAEVSTGLANDLSWLSVILGGVTVAVAAIVLKNRKGRYDAGAWVVAVLGACLAFRAFVYQAPALAIAFVALSGILYVSALVLGYSAWRAEVQAAYAASAR